LNVEQALVLMKYLIKWLVKEAKASSLMVPKASERHIFIGHCLLKSAGWI
jgi:hypothetical protein